MKCGTHVDFYIVVTMIWLSGVWCRVTHTLESRRTSLFQNVVNHTQRYVTEELRHRLDRCDSVKELNRTQPFILLESKVRVI
jgi:hypothetical protein